MKCLLNTIQVAGPKSVANTEHVFTDSRLDKSFLSFPLHPETPWCPQGPPLQRIRGLFLRDTSTVT